MGWGGNGWGGFGGNGRGAIANEINNDYGRSLLMDAIGGNRNALTIATSVTSQSTTTIPTTAVHANVATMIINV